MAIYWSGFCLKRWLIWWIFSKQILWGAPFLGAIDILLVPSPQIHGTKESECARKSCSLSLCSQTQISDLSAQVRPYVRRMGKGFWLVMGFSRELLQISERQAAISIHWLEACSSCCCAMAHGSQSSFAAVSQV